MYQLCSEIKINNVLFEGVNAVKIHRSVNSLASTALIKVPVTAVFKQKDGSRMATETAKTVKVGDAVSIKLGYNEILQQEFRGYVKQIKYTLPLEIECEDAYYSTRYTSVSLSGTVSLSDSLEKCGLEVAHAVNLNLKNFVVDNKSVAWVLARLKSDYGLNVFFDINGKVVAGRAFDVIKEKVKYELRYNIIKDDDLKYQSAADVKMQVQAICFKKDGTHLEGKAGNEGGIVKTLHFYDVEDEKQLQILAETELKKYARDGYSGKIETFLLPYAEPCMQAELTDTVYPERSGTYYIESVETSFSTSGARREVSIGIKI